MQRHAAYFSVIGVLILLQKRADLSVHSPSTLPNIRRIAHFIIKCKGISKVFQKNHARKCVKPQKSRYSPHFPPAVTGNGDDLCTGPRHRYGLGTRTHRSPRLCFKRAQNNPIPFRSFSSSSVIYLINCKFFIIFDPFTHLSVSFFAFFL